MLGFIFPDVWATRARNTIYIYIFRIHMFIAKYGVYARSITLALRSRCQLPIFSGILGNVALIIYIYILHVLRERLYTYTVFHCFRLVITLRSDINSICGCYTCGFPPRRCEIKGDFTRCIGWGGCGRMLLMLQAMSHSSGTLYIYIHVLSLAVI